MSIFGRKFTARDKPTNNIGSTFSFLFGGTASGKNVNERTAMQTTVVYACVRILAESLAGLPIHIQRREKDGSHQKALDHPLYALLHDAPNEEMTSFVFRETLMTHLLLWGNAYAQIIRNGRGQPIALYPLLPNRMDVNRSESGSLLYSYRLDMEEKRFKSWNGREITADKPFRLDHLGKYVYLHATWVKISSIKDLYTAGVDFKFAHSGMEIADIVTMNEIMLTGAAGLALDRLEFAYVPLFS